MKKLIVIPSLLAAAFLARADVFPFDISPPGVSPAEGLSPSNHLHAVVDSTGSGNEILSGIQFDTETLILDLAFGYGSIAGFEDLTGPVTAVHLHGPADSTMDAEVLVDLAPLHSPAGDPANGGIVFGSVVLDEPTSSNLLAGLTYINLHTEANPDGELRGQLVGQVNYAPTITPMDPLTLELTGPNGAVGTLSVDVSDADDDPLTVVWTVDGSVLQTNMVAAGESAAGVTVQFRGSFGLGTHEVTATVEDDDQASNTSFTTVTVVDTVAPVIHALKATPSVLWPPNHRLRPVRIDVRASDASGALRARIIGITSNEEMDGLGDGNTKPDYRVSRAATRSRKARSRQADSSDWRMVSPLRVLLRAERSGLGSGRVYTIEVEVRDGSDNVTTGAVEVTVPHDRGNGRANAKGYNKIKKNKKNKK